MKKKVYLITLLVTALLSCNGKERKSTGAQFMNHTLNDYLPFVEKHHLSPTAHPLQKDIVELCKQINRITGEIIIAAGGWNEYGEFIDGKQKGIGLEIINNYKLLEVVHEFKRNIKVNYGEQVDTKDIIEELNGDLYLITDYWTKEKLKK